MKKLILILVLSLFPGMLFAETVMLLTRMHPAETERGANFERFVAVEDGVEDQFFSAGHIIFDAGVPRASDSQTEAVARTDRWAEQTARAGGAAFLLIVNLKFPDPHKAAPLPSAVNYSFVDLKNGSTLARGTIDAQVIEQGQKSKKPYDLCFALGQKIARNAMSNWKSNS